MLIHDSRLPIRDILIFGFLPNPIKKIIYRIKGYKLGKKVSIGFGAVICGEDVQIGDNTEFGFFSIIRGKKIIIGSRVKIGATSIIDTPYLEIGDGSKINELVFVGGLQYPDSKFVLGKNCQVMQMSFINPAKSIVVGNDTGIGGDCLLFGHTSWLNRFEGYPVEFDSIEIGNSVSLSWRVFLLPGTKIGDGSVIGANSLVRGTIPQRCLAMGFPARVVSKSPEFPHEISDEEKVHLLKDIVSEMIKYFMDSSLECEKTGTIYWVNAKNRRHLFGKKRKWSLDVRYDNNLLIDGMDITQHPDIILSLKTIPFEMRKIFNSQNIMWIDIEKKEQSSFSNDLGEEIVLFLKRYGVRLIREGV